MNEQSKHYLFMALLADSPVFCYSSPFISFRAHILLFVFVCLLSPWLNSELLGAGTKTECFITVSLVLRAILPHNWGSRNFWRLHLKENKPSFTKLDLQPTRQKLDRNVKAGVPAGCDFHADTHWGLPVWILLLWLCRGRTCFIRSEFSSIL